MADVSEPLSHHATSGGRHVNTYPLASDILSGNQSGTTATEGIQDNIVLITAGGNNAVEQGNRLLCGIDPKVGNVRNVGPELCESWVENEPPTPSLFG
jgi:hypothetical protein